MFIFPVGLVQNLDKSLKVYHANFIVIKTSKIAFLLLLSDFKDLVDSGLELIKCDKAILVGVQLIEGVIRTDFFIVKRFSDLRIEFIHFLNIELFNRKKVGFDL